jgi:hypothetical protein
MRQSAFSNFVSTSTKVLVFTFLIPWQSGLAVASDTVSNYHLVDVSFKGEAFCDILETFIDEAPHAFYKQLGTQLSDKKYVSKLTIPGMSRCIINQRSSMEATLECRGSEGTNDELGILRAVFKDYTDALDYCLLEKTFFFRSWDAGKVGSVSGVYVTKKSYYQEGQGTKKPGVNIQIYLKEPDDTKVYFVGLKLKYY